MEYIFIGIYNFFQKHKLAFYSVFIGLFALAAFGALQINLEEDVSKFFPKDKKIEKLNEVFQNSKFMEKMVVVVSLKDSTAQAQPDSLISYTDDLVLHIQEDLNTYIRKVTYKVDEELALQMFGTLHDHLPVFLDETDYK